jgi:hypothetical protein
VPMRRLVAAVVLFALFALVAACEGNGENPPTTTPSTSAPPSPTVTPLPSVTSSPTSSPSSPPAPHLRLPGDAPTEIADPASLAAVAAGDLTPLAPPGATVTSTWVLTMPGDPIEQVALAWQRGETDPFAIEHGFVVWQPAGTGSVWRAVYAFTDRPAKQVLGVSFETGDVTGDGIDDALTFEQTGGSGACGTWRVIASSSGAAAEVFRERTCDTEIRIAGGALERQEAVFETGDAHCCPSAYRFATLGWDGETFVETSSEIRDTSA